MHLEIVSPEAQLFSGQVESITVPGTSGSFQILNNHAPIVSSLTQGQVILQGKISMTEEMKKHFTQAGDKTLFTIQSGVIEMRDNKAILLSD
jgi:F-type H+-transporting ATPase subunit epsilon